MKRAIGILLVACCAVASAGPASAAGKGTTLLPGGNTIAGPVEFLADGGHQVMLASGMQGTFDLGVCVTLANLSKVEVVLGLGYDQPDYRIAPSATSVACSATAHSVTVVCTLPEGRSCPVTWRMDLIQ